MLLILEQRWSLHQTHRGSPTDIRQTNGWNAAW